MKFAISWGESRILQFWDPNFKGIGMNPYSLHLPPQPLWPQPLWPQPLWQPEQPEVLMHRFTMDLTPRRNGYRWKLIIWGYGSKLGIPIIVWYIRLYKYISILYNTIHYYKMNKKIGYRWLVGLVWSVMTGQASWIIHDGGIATWVAGTAALLRRGGLGDASGHRSPTALPLSPEKPRMSLSRCRHEGCSVTLKYWHKYSAQCLNCKILTQILTDANPLVSFQLLIQWWFAISAQSLAHSNTMLGCCEPWMHQDVERSNNKSFYSNDAQLPHKETSKARWWLCPVLSETAAPFSFLSVPVNPHKQLSWHLLLLGRMKWVWSESNPSRFGRHFDLHAMPFNVFLA